MIQTLFLIPARGGSKGLPGKNIKPLAGKPLLHYSIEFARHFTSDQHICLSTDSDEIISCANDCKLDVKFRRPEVLASDVAGSREVILHAVEFYRSLGIHYDRVALLQPTSPFRSKKHMVSMLDLYKPEIDMVVSVKLSHANPYFSLFEEEPSGFLRLSKQSSYTRRQDCPEVYAFNGSIYLINTQSLGLKKMQEFDHIVKYVMDDIHSVDIDNQFDWWTAEMILEKSLFKNN